MKPVPSFAATTDRDLIAAVKQLAVDECEATAALIASLAELDARRLYRGQGCASLFAYCTQVLHLSGDAAYGRIETARLARRFPIVLDLLAAGAVTMTAVGLLEPLLTEENHRALLDAARHKSKRDVEHMVAALRPQPDVPASIRKLPVARGLNPHAPTETTRDFDSPGASPFAVSLLESGPPCDSASAPAAVPAVHAAVLTQRDSAFVVAAPASAPAHRPLIAPLAPDRYKVQFTVSGATHDKLTRAQELLRHAVPNGDPAEIFDRALTLLVEHLERRKAGKANRPRPPQRTARHTRHIPSAVKRAVRERDEDRCAFVGTEGRCRERGFLEYHHVVPYADGGHATVDNLQRRCRAHNQYEAEAWFGPLVARERPPIAFD